MTNFDSKIVNKSVFAVRICTPSDVVGTEMTCNASSAEVCRCYLRNHKLSRRSMQKKTFSRKVSNQIYSENENAWKK